MLIKKKANILNNIDAKSFNKINIIVKRNRDED